MIFIISMMKIHEGRNMTRLIIVSQKEKEWKKSVKSEMKISVGSVEFCALKVARSEKKNGGQWTVRSLKPNKINKCF